MDMKLIGFETIDRSSELLRELSQYLFLNPELAYKETKAHDYLCQFLETQGFKVDRNFIHETGFQATFETASKPHVALVVEYDALPFIGHACGHNLIAESSVAAALGLLAMMKKGLLCKLSVFGTPAEEGGAGKIKFISEGCFSDVDACMMSHPYKLNILEKSHIAAIGLTVSYTGKEAHASLEPWNGKNALDAAVMAYQSISCLRQQISPVCRIHGIITNGGEASNIIPRFTKMEYCARHPNRKGLLELLSRIYACFQSAATMTGCEVSISESCQMYEDLNNNRPLADIFYKNAVQLGIEFSPDCRDISPSSDIGNVSYVCPTIQPVYEIGTTASNHTVEFAEASNTLEAHIFSLRQAKAMLATFADIILDNSGELLRGIKESFKGQLNN